METVAKDTKYWHQLPDGRLQCDLCPRNCKLQKGQRGFCYVRGVENGEVVLHAYGRTTGLAVDPIEKKPLYHFYPGTPVLSFGTIGCNLACKFCQNAHISRCTDTNAMYETSVEQIVGTAESKGTQHIAFTYNEPVVFLEFARDVAELAHSRELNTVAVTAGYISEQARSDFFSFIDAANVDLKAFNDEFYKNYTGGRLLPVLDTLKYIKQETDVWLEITTLLIPGLNDSESELHELSEWIAENLGENVPLHFSAFHPANKMTDRQRTPLSTLKKARRIARSKGLKYVYTGNVYDPEGSATRCPGCGQLLIKREAYSVTVKNMDVKGCCYKCGTQIAGRF